MRNFAITALIVGACVAGGLALDPATSQGVKAGKKAPAFSAQATDGKAHSLKGHTEKGTTFLYFIKEGCPVNHQAAPHVQKLAAAYGEKANLVGVFDGPLARAKGWTKQYRATFPVLEDPDVKVIHAYGALYSPWLVAVNPDGTVKRVFEGASPKELAEINLMMASAAGQKPAKLDFTGSPTGGG